MDAKIEQEMRECRLCARNCGIDRTRFPGRCGMTAEIREAAKAAGVDYVMDVFTPHYGSDGDGSVLAGYDIRHAAIGPGTANSHGYERTHIDGLRNTFDLAMAYIAG